MPSILPFTGYYPLPALASEMLQGLRFDKYATIEREFPGFLKEGLIGVSAKPAFYYLEIKTAKRHIRGLWASTRVSDLSSGAILGHERISHVRSDEIKKTFTAGGLDSNPIVLHGQLKRKLSLLYQDLSQQSPVLEASGPSVAYTLWEITNQEQLIKLVASLKTVGQIYLADGHHRAAALLNYTRGRDLYFSSLYFDDEDLDIHAFHRVIDDLQPLNYEDLLRVLNRYYHLEPLEAESVSLPASKGSITMISSRAGSCILTRREIIEEENDLGFFERVTAESPGRGELRFEGGPFSETAIALAVKKASDAVAFLFFPPRLREIQQVADQGEFMPVKSSWFEPKIPTGLLIRMFR